MKKWLAITVLISASGVAYSQSNPVRATSYVDVTVGAGSYKGSVSLGYSRLWKFGEKRKFGIGLGTRFTSFIGANQYYITAPAALTSESTSPLIFFKENIIENIDSLLVKSPQVNAMNLTVTLDYAVTKKITMGFSIDAVGFSFGGGRHGNYINGVEGKNTTGKPTAFNILLISDNDRGTLNSEFYGRYTLTQKWHVKVGAQFLFTEYTTKTQVQTLPEKNDRFRNKALLFELGLICKI